MKTLRYWLRALFLSPGVTVGALLLVWFARLGADQSLLVAVAAGVSAVVVWLLWDMLTEESMAGARHWVHLVVYTIVVALAAGALTRFEPWAAVVLAGWVAHLGYDLLGLVLDSSSRPVGSTAAPAH